MRPVAQVSYYRNGAWRSTPAPKGVTEALGRRARNNRVWFSTTWMLVEGETEPRPILQASWAPPFEEGEKDFVSVMHVYEDHQHRIPIEIELPRPDWPIDADGRGLSVLEVERGQHLTTVTPTQEIAA